MAKTVGLSRNIKMQWLNKAVALLDDNLDETEYKSALNDYLGFEIGSAINIRKTREILMHLQSASVPWSAPLLGICLQS